jgi:hypothetical protein
MKIELLRERAVALPLFPPHIPHGLAWDQTAGTFACPLLHLSELSKTVRLMVTNALRVKWPRQLELSQHDSF